MRNVAARFLWFLAATVLASAAARGQAEPSYVIEARLLNPAPILDGKMADGEWKEAAVLEGFTQFEPEEGVAATEQTVVRIGYDERKLYVGVRCYDSKPEKIVGIVMNRDADLSAGTDDTIQIVLDTFHDRSNGFLFETNPVGAQRDALVRNEGDEVNYNWDGIWSSVTSRDGEGWTAEIAIPFRTLRFSRTPEQTWGINIGRVIARKFEYTSWRPVPRYQVLGASIFRVSQAGELTGLRNLKQGRSFDIKPYLLAQGERSDKRGDDSSLDAGIDVRKNITSNLVLDLTYNLDFAEAEADEQQVNITRFPLFFTEKREFFLEGANIFFFGERGDAAKPAERTFFFSRRIGLSEDGLENIPVLGGAKLSGTVGRLSIGLLNLTTEDHRYRDRQDEERFEPQTNYTALRLKQDVLKKSSIGLIWLNKAVSEGPDNRGVGVDWNFALGKHLKTGGYFADTSSPGLEDASWAGEIDFVWEDEKILARGSYAEVGEGFNPEMGFFPRIGVRQSRGLFAYHLTPKKLGLRDIYLIDHFDNITDRDGNLETRSNGLEGAIFWPKYWGIAVKYFEHAEAIDVPFEINPGVVIPPGEYRFRNYFFGIQGVPSLPVYPFSRVSFGEFWDGDFIKALVGVILRPMPGLSAHLTWERTDVELPAGDFVVDLGTANIIYSINPRISIRTHSQWRSDDNFDIKLVFRWTYKPGAALYVVYDEFRDLADLEGTGTDRSDRSLLTKVSFFL